MSTEFIRGPFWVTWNWACDFHVFFERLYRNTMYINMLVCFLFFFISYIQVCFSWTVPWITSRLPFQASSGIVSSIFCDGCDDQCNRWSMKDAYNDSKVAKASWPFLKPQIKPLAGNGHFMRLQSGVASMGSSLKDFMFANGSRSFTILPNRVHLSFWEHFDPWIPPFAHQVLAEEPTNDVDKHTNFEDLFMPSWPTWPTFNLGLF